LEQKKEAVQKNIAGARLPVGRHAWRTQYDNQTVFWTASFE